MIAIPDRSPAAAREAIRSVTHLVLAPWGPMSGVDQEPRGRAENLRPAGQQGKGTVLDQEHQETLPGRLQLLGRHPEKIIALFDKHMK